MATSKNEFNFNILDNYLINKDYELNSENIQQNISIFNNFLKHKIPKNILGFKEIELNKNEKTRVNVINYVLIKKHHNLEDGTFIIITPEIAKKYNLTYSFDIFIDMNIYDKNKKVINTVKNIWLGSIPIMIGSSECKLITMIDKEDKGGYFIINGVDKILNKNNEL